MMLFLGIYLGSVFGSCIVASAFDVPGRAVFPTVLVPIINTILIFVAIGILIGSCFRKRKSNG